MMDRSAIIKKRQKEEKEQKEQNDKLKKLKEKKNHAAEKLLDIFDLISECYSFIAMAYAIRMLETKYRYHKNEMDIFVTSDIDILHNLNNSGIKCLNPFNRIEKSFKKRERVNFL